MSKNIIDIKKIVKRKKSVRKLTTTKLVPTVSSISRKVVRFKPVKFEKNLLSVSSPIAIERKVFVKRVEPKLYSLFFSVESMQKLAMIIIFALSSTGLNTIGLTSAYYSDIESSGSNGFLGGSLDISLSNESYKGMIGNSPEEKLVFQTSVVKEAGILPTQYEILYEKIDGSDSVCNALNIKSTNGVLNYDGAVSGIYTGATNDFGVWDFEVSVLPGEEVPYGETCSFDIVFSAWLDGVITSIESGYMDIARFHVVVNTESQSVEVLELAPEALNTETEITDTEKTEEDLVEEVTEEQPAEVLEEVLPESEPEKLSDVVVEAIQENEEKTDTGPIVKEIIQEMVVPDEVPAIKDSEEPVLVEEETASVE